jgi:ubiquinone/menaquinone biosynthesis C-methylase UbiE
MEHAELVAMIRDGVTSGAWADLGSGDGAFTLALADLLGPEPEGSIVSVDRDGGALRRQREAMQARFPATRVEYVHADFTRPLDLPRLDGVVMANSLHFVRNKAPVLELVRGALRPGGRLVLVEYDADRGNPWVPHPLSFSTWERVSEAADLIGTRLLARRPSRFLNAMYSALSHKDDGLS